jgi:hypothetical protein
MSLLDFYRMPRRAIILSYAILLALISVGVYNLGQLPEILRGSSFEASPYGQKDTPPPPGHEPPPAHISPKPAEGQYCKWVFDKYESSAYEGEWFQEVSNVQSTTPDGTNICKAQQAEKHVAASRAIVGRAINLTAIDPKIQWKTYNTMPTTTLDPADQYMSRMYYRRLCYNEEEREFYPASGYGIQLIEPLFGMLRDPFDHYCGSDKLTIENYPNTNPGQSKHHIVPQGFAPYTFTTKAGRVESTEWRTHGIPPWHSFLRPVYNEQVGTTFSTPENIHVDLGSSYFGGWTQDSSAASGQWFYDMYHARGQKFNRFVAVEVETLDDTKVYEQVPADLIGIYTLMNIGLTMGGDKLNAVELIKRIVKPEDFFVLKLDIDSAPIEESIIQNLLAGDSENGGTSALIDELMYEHHVNFWPMNGPWHIASTSKKDGDLLTSYNLFRDLRRKGIRAHSWP